MDLFLTTSTEHADPGIPHTILIGLPGSGKSTVGRAVADRLGRPFLDFDREIERRSAASVAEIFAQHGEAMFRELERELTRQLRGSGNMILAPGGGWIGNPDVVELLRPPARLVYLEVHPDTALLRLGDDRHSRPLLSRPDPLSEMRRLLASRRAAYTAADFVVNTEVLDLQRVIDTVAELASPSHAG